MSRLALPRFAPPARAPSTTHRAYSLYLHYIPHDSTLLEYIPHDENTAAGRPRAGGWRRGARRLAIGGGALVNTEKQKIKPKANKLSKRDALQND